MNRKRQNIRDLIISLSKKVEPKVEVKEESTQAKQVPPRTPESTHGECSLDGPPELEPEDTSNDKYCTPDDSPQLDSKSFRDVVDESDLEDTQTESLTTINSSPVKRTSSDLESPRSSSSKTSPVLQKSTSPTVDDISLAMMDDEQRQMTTIQKQKAF